MNAAVSVLAIAGGVLGVGLFAAQMIVVVCRHVAWVKRQRRLRRIPVEFGGRRL